MQSANFSDFPAHKKTHDDFVAKISGLSAPVDSATVHFAKDWSVIRDCVMFRSTSNSLLFSFSLFVGRREGLLPVNTSFLLH